MTSAPVPLADRPRHPYMAERDVHFVLAIQDIVAAALRQAEQTKDGLSRQPRAAISTIRIRRSHLEEATTTELIACVRTYVRDYLGAEGLADV